MSDERQPSGDVLLTHIQYIREGMDEVRTDVKAVLQTTAALDARVTALEHRQPEKPRRGLLSTLAYLLGVATGIKAGHGL